MRRTKPGFAIGRESSPAEFHLETLVEPDVNVY